MPTRKSKKPSKKKGGSRDEGNGGGRVKLQIATRFHGADQREEQPRAAAYVFDRGGRLLESTDVAKDGTATVVLESSDADRALRVLVGPVIEEDKAPRASELLRRGAEESHVRLAAGGGTHSLEVTVLDQAWLCWLLSGCVVPGTLTKRVELDGIPAELPVCGATVEVYEVDPIYLLVPRLSADVLERIRDLVLEPAPEPPVPDPGPLASGLGAARFQQRESRVAENLPRTLTDLVPQDLNLAALSGSEVQLRDALVRHVDFTRLILCRYFPHFVHMQLVATATTDECGRFRAFFFRGCNNPDQPDLYFKAKQKLGPFTFDIYSPTPISCHTRWNYACGTEVKLTTTHFFARACTPCPPIEPPEPGLNWVAVMHIGNLPLSRIRGASADAGIQASTGPGNEGLCFIDAGEANDAGSFDGRPFGSLLRLHLEFDNSLHDLGIRYYQASWRRAGEGDFQPLTGEIHRHYSHEPPGATAPVFEVYSLGPHVVNGKELFEIPPTLPPKGQWVVTDLVEDQTSAKLPSHLLVPAPDHGKVELKIDLFDAAGNLVDVDAAGSQVTYVVPEQLDLAANAPVTTVEAAGLGLVVDDDGDGNRSFVMTLHVDNNTCTAEVGKAQISGVDANACGVLAYNPGNTGANVTMPFEASHPNGFATYHFTLRRGVENLPAQAMSGQAIPPGNFEQSATVATLLGACPVAAFSQALRAAALATSGWGRLSGYDAFDHAAFVLAPPMPGGGGGS